MWDARVGRTCGTQVWDASVGRKCGTHMLHNVALACAEMGERAAVYAEAQPVKDS